MKTLILHAGLHKTGSTVIQETLAASRPSLHTQGVSYPVFCNPDGRHEANHSLMLLSVFSSGDRQISALKRRGWAHRDAAAIYQKQLEDVMNTTSEVLILSGEEVSQLDEGGLTRLKKKFQQWHIRVVVYIRPAYSYFCSAQQEQIKNGAAKIITSHRWVKPESLSIEKLQHAFPELEAVSFPLACSHQYGPAGDFFERTELTFSPKHLRPYNNPGLGNVVTRLCAHINNYSSSNKISRSQVNGASLMIGEPRFRLSKAELSELSEMFIWENEQIYSLTKLDFRDEKMHTSSLQKLNPGKAFILALKLMMQPPVIRRVGLLYLLEQGHVSTFQLRVFKLWLPIAMLVKMSSSTVRRLFRR